MNKRYYFILAPLCYVLCGCAAKSYDVYNRNISTAHNFREYCQSNQITSGEITTADSLLKSALSSKEQQKFEDAEWQADLASTYYKIGILTHDLSHSRENVKQLKTELAADKEKLNGLIEVYEEIKSLRKQ